MTTRPRAIACIVVDLDGTLLDIWERHYGCYLEAIAHAGGHALPRERYIREKRAAVPRTTLLALSGLTGTAHRFDEAWHQLIETPARLASDRLQIGAVELLEAASRAGVSVVLATMRRNTAAVGNQLEELGIATGFEEVLVAGEAGEKLTKGGLLGRRGNTTAAESTIWIGDTEEDIAAARSLGIRVAATASGLRSSAFLSARSPDWLQDDLVALRAAIPLHG